MSLEKQREVLMKHTRETGGGCWEWTAARMRSGYGQMRLPNCRKNDGAHRVSWRVFRGEIPVGMMICHKCDNKLCVNPDHLFVGTQFDNMADCIRKGRFLEGERHPNTKLTDRQVRIIRARRADGASQYKLARRFSVSQAHISVLVLNKWRVSA